MTRARADLALALLLAIVFAWAAREAVAYPSNARLVPLAIALPALALALLQAASSLRDRGSSDAAAPSAAALPVVEEEEIPPRVRARRSAVFAGWIAATLLGMWLVGFAATAALLALAYSRSVGRESWRAAFGVTAVAWGLIFGVFDRLLHVPLPAGELLRVLGLG